MESTATRPDELVDHISSLADQLRRDCAGGDKLPIYQDIRALRHSLLTLEREVRDGYSDDALGDAC